MKNVQREYGRRMVIGANKFPGSVEYLYSTLLVACRCTGGTIIEMHLSMGAYQQYVNAGRDRR